jgi:hypothetical protein
VAVAVTGTLVATDAAFAEPNPVTDLTSTPVADGTMGRLSWTPVPGATSYTVRLSVTDAAVASAYVQLTTSTNSIIPGAYLATLPGEQIVYWKVAATVEASTGNVTTAYSEVAGFTRAALPAPVTTPVTSPVVYPAATSFAWAPVTGASSYTVQWSQDSTFATGVTKTTTTATSWTPTTALTRDAPWYWQVAANLVSYAFTNTSTPALTSVATAPSDGGSFSIVWDEPSTGTDESRPVLLSDGSNSSGWVSDPILSWAPVTGAKYYLVSVGTAVSGSAVTSLVIDSAVSYATTYVPRQLLEDKAYFWQVTAVDSAGGKGHASSYKEFHKAWGAQTAPTSVSLAGTTAPVPNGGAYSGASTLGAAPSVPIDRLELSWQPLARATEYVVSVYGVVLDPSDPSQGSASSVPFATCTTASTSATIISGAQEVSAAADGMTACLWPSDASKRLTVGQTYKWGVEAYMVDATKTTVRVHSASSYDTAPLYFSLGAAASGPVVNADSYVISGDETAFATQTVTALKGQPAPVFTWSPVSGATLYQVEISLNKDFTSTAARFWTPQTTLRPTGVLADTTTSLPYYWRVKGGTFKTATSLDFDKSAWPPAADAGYSWRTWQRLSTKTLAAPTPVTQVDGAVVLRWAPESESAPNDGGTGGYVVRIYEGDSATGTPVNTDAGTKTNVPFLVACTGTCATDVPLTEGGRYTFTVNPLNALGAEGTVSDAVSFTVAASAPVLAGRAVLRGQRHPTVGSDLVGRQRSADLGVDRADLGDHTGNGRE